MRRSETSRARYPLTIDQAQIAEAVDSLVSMLQLPGLAGKRFLDVGCGCGLFSLAARRLGAQVHSFDRDPQSVARTQALRQRYYPSDPDWTIHAASVLDRHYLASLGQYDVVYSWGVLHHTGALWQALDNIAQLPAPGGLLYVSVYNDQGFLTGYWRAAKKIYASSVIGQWLILLLHAPYMYGARWLARSLPGRKRTERGMSLWEQMRYVLEGHPFEVARPEDVVRFYWSRGFLLERARLCGSRHACNEFVFVKDAASAAESG
jgi:2-polyprenyl-3-methyl-5-hydroxy-6-metoxy-1,4-benzoquinol methylase